MASKHKKPTVGLKPEFLHKEMIQFDRLVELSEAINRYAADNHPIPVKWSDELRRGIANYKVLRDSKNTTIT